MFTKRRIYNFGTKFNNIKNDEMTRHSTAMFVATAISGFLSYVYQIYIGRALGPEQYGVFGALFAIFYVINVLSQTISTSITKFTSQLIDGSGNIGFFIKGTLFRAGVFGAVISLILFILSNNIASFLKINENAPLLILSLIFFLIWIQAVLGGVLRGLKLFTKLGAVRISDAFFKLVCGSALVILGYGVAGAMTGLALGIIFSLFLSGIFLIKYFNPDKIDISFKYSEVYTYSFPVLLAMICYSFPCNMDVILAKYFFTAKEAGYYTSASVLGKIIFFFPAAIYSVMFPMIAERHFKGKNTVPLLKKSLIYTSILISPLTALYLFSPITAVKIFGHSYMPAVSLISPYGVAISFFSLSVILMYYHLAIKNTKYIFFFASFTAIEFLLLCIFHNSPLQMVTLLMVGNGVLLGLSGIWTWKLTSKICKRYSN